ncbi:MAG: hypothetical protein L0207_02775 [Chlamydiae bacterium]|nr:hypothetical protein [Chlamydiota bacterium]
MLRILCFLCCLLNALHAQVTWFPPINLSATGQTALEPQVTIDVAGNAIAIWRRSNGVNLIIQAATKLFGGDWSTPVDLSAPGQNALEPQIAVNPAGNAIAIWTRNSIIQAATKSFGDGWSTPIDVFDPGQPAQRPQIAVDAAGNGIAVCERSNGTNSIIQTATKPFGGNWSTPVDLSAPGQSAVRPQVVVDPIGNAVAIWRRNNGVNDIIQAATKLFGENWSTPVDLSAAGQDADFAQVAVDPAGNAVAVWLRNLITQAATKPFKNNWSTPVDLSDVGLTIFTPQITLDPAGNGVAIWTRSNGANFIIQPSQELSQKYFNTIFAP